MRRMKLRFVIFAVLISLTALVFSFESLFKESDKIDNVKAKEVCTCYGSGFPNKSLGEFSLSWYSPKELGKTKASELRTSKGLIPQEGRTIAVDPRVIPYGSIVYIEGYGYYIAEDCGIAINGNKIDIFMNSYEQVVKNGRKRAQVWVMKEN